MSIKGVETNESSRFIDHTLATPWESFIADIERAIKRINSDGFEEPFIKISYLDYNFKLEKKLIDTSREGSLKELTKIENPFWFYKNYKIKWYLLLSFDSDSEFYPKSMKQTIKSAFVTSINFLEYTIYPIFLTFNSNKDIAISGESFGYEVIRSNHSFSSKSSNYYESFTFESLSPKHPINFFDGVRNLFYRKLTAIDPYRSHSLMENFHSISTFSYLFSKEDFYNILLNQEFRKVKKYNPFPHKLFKLLTHLQSESQRKTLSLTNLLIELQFCDSQQSSIIDNASYTTYTPSSQPPNSWKIKSNFTSIKPKSENSPFEKDFPILAADWMARCIRNLLSFYIFSLYCSKEDINMDKLSNENLKTSEIIDRESLAEVIEVLSIESKEAFLELFPLDDTFVDYESQSQQSATEYSKRVYKSRSSTESNVPNYYDLETLSAASNTPSPTPGSPLPNSREPSADLWNEFEFSEQQSDIIDFLFKSNKPIENSIQNELWPNFLEPINLSGPGLFEELNIQDILEEFKISPLGHWFGIFSILSGCLNGEIDTIVKLWTSCLRELQNCWDTGTIINPFLNFDMESITKKDIEKILADQLKTVPICKRKLWEDSILRKRCDGIFLEWPNLSDSIILQKLQFLQFCIISKFEESVYNPKFLFGPDLPFEVQNPTLFRRVPLTEDVIYMHKRIAKKVHSGSSQSGKTHPFLKWQLEIPSLGSDMKAFKHANPQASFQQFCQWYGIEEDMFIDPKNPNGDGGLEKIWNDCVGISCQDQNPLFHPRKEAEKIFAFLEKISIKSLAKDLLSNALKYLFLIINIQINFWTDKLFSNILNPAIDSFQKPRDQNYMINLFKRNILSEITLLKEQMHKAQESLNSSTDNTDNGEEKSTNSSLIMLIDSVAGLFQNLQAFCFRAEKLCTILDSWNDSKMSTMVFNLAMKDCYTAQNNDEANVLTNLIKSLNKRERGLHDWHSHDGRELGAPLSKSFSIFYGEVIDSLRMSDAPFLSLDGSPDRDERDHKSSFSIDLEDEFEDSLIRMDTIIVEDKARVVFKIPES